MDKGFQDPNKKLQQSNASALSKDEQEHGGNSMLPPELTFESSEKVEEEEQQKEEVVEEQKEEVVEEKQEEQKETEASTSEEKEAPAPTIEFADDEGPGDNNSNNNNGDGSNAFQLNSKGNGETPKSKTPFNFKEDSKKQKETTQKPSYDFGGSGGGDGNGGNAGNGLPNEVNNKMESAFNADFSNVKVHKDSQKSKDIGAYAFTQGNEVHFAPGQFKPYSIDGQELIGHELSHVVQQSEQKVEPTKEVSGVGINDNKNLEKEADAKGKKAANQKDTPAKNKKKPKPKKAVAQSKEVIQRAAAPAPPTSSAPTTKGTSTAPPTSPGPASPVPAFALFGNVLDIDFENVGSSQVLIINVDIAPLATAVKAEVTIDEGAFVSGKLIVVSDHLPGTELVLNVAADGTVSPTLTIKETMLVLGMQATVNAEVTPEGIVGNLTVELPGTQQITDNLKATSGAVSFDLGQGGKFSGNVAVETNDGFVSGTAAVTVDYDTKVWSGTATVTSTDTKQITLTEGVDIILPAGMALTLSFGTEGVDLAITAGAQIEVELKTADGVELEGLLLASIGIGINTSGITITSVSINATTTYKEMEAAVVANLTEEGFAGTVTLSLLQPKPLGDSITAESGSLLYTFGEGGFFTGNLTVKTNDNFAVGTAAVTYDQTTNQWAGTATVSTQEDKTINLLPGATILLPAGIELSVSFGPDGTQILGSASAQINVDINTTDGLQMNSVSVGNIELGIDNSGVTLISLSLDSTTTIYDMQAHVVGSMTEEGFAGTVTIDLLEPKAITNSITAESGQITYAFGTGGAFQGNIQVKTNDGFAVGSAEVSFDPLTSAWAGVATVSSQQAKVITIAGGIELTLPAGMELTISFGPDGTQLEGDASAQINIDLSTTDGLDLTQVAVADIQLSIDNTGISIVSASLDSTTTVFGMEARVVANLDQSGITGSVNIDIVDPISIADFLTIQSGSVSFDFGMAGGFEGTVYVVTNDGFAAGSASVSFDPETENWAGVATVMSLASKFIEVTPGVGIELPAGIEISVGFGSGEIDIDGLANVLVHIDLNTGSGMNVQGEAEVVIRFDNSGITIVSVYLTSTTQILGMDADVEVTIDENGLKGTVNLELSEPFNISSYLVAEAGSFSFDIGSTGLITGALQVNTTDGFAAGTAQITIDPVTHSWTGVAIVSSLAVKEIEIATGVKLVLPAGAELRVEFGSEGISVQVTGNIVAEVDVISESGVQARGIADLDISFGTEGIAIAPNVIVLAVTGGLTTPDIDAIVEDGHLTTTVDNGAILTLSFGEDGKLTTVDLEATGGFSNSEKRIGRISFAGQVNLNPLTLNGILHAVSQAELDILDGERFDIVLVAGSQFFVYLDEQGVSNIDASLAADLKDGEEALARLKMIGMLPRDEGLSLQASIELLKDLQIIEATENHWGLSLKSGASLGATIENGGLSSIEGTLGLGVQDMQGELFSGELSGVIGISQPEHNLAIESGSGSLTLQRDYVMELNAGDVIINSGSYFQATFGEGTLTGIGGLVDAAYDDGTNVISILADLDYDTVNNRIRSLDASLETDAEFFLFNDALKISELSGGISIRDNQLIAIGGHARLDAEIGDFVLAGEADLAWLNSEEGTKFVGNGWLEFAWSEEGENPDKYFMGRVDASIDGDQFEILGQIEMGLMKGLTGAASIWIDQEMDPIISASLTYSTTLMEADELWSFEQDFGVSFMFFPGIAISAGIMLGIGIFTRPLIVMGTAGVENWRPKSKAFPDFYAEISASWGIDLEAKVLAYLGLTLGLDNVLFFEAGIRAGLGIKIPIELNPFITLHGGEEGIWGEVGLNLSIQPIMELIIEAYMQWGVLGFWEGDRTFPIENQDLGELGGLQWSGSFAFGDKEEASQNAPQIPEQIEAPNATPTVESGEKPDGLGIGNQENGPTDAEGGLGSLTDGIGSPAKEGEEPGGLGNFGDEMTKVGEYAEGIGAVGDLIGIIMEGFKWFMTGGPVGLILWIIFKKPNKTEMDAKRDKVEDFRQALTGDVIEQGSTIDRMLGILSGEYSFWTIFNPSIPYQSMVDDGLHRDPDATIDGIADICDGMIKGWTGEGDESRLVEVLRYVHDTKGNAATREMVDKSGGRKKWEDQFESLFWQDSNDRGHLKRIFNEAYGEGVYSSGNKPTYTAEPGATIEIDGRSKDDLAATAFGDASYRYYVDIYNEENNPGLNGTVSGGIGNYYATKLYYLPSTWAISGIANQNVWEARYAIPPGHIEYTHSFESYNMIAQRAYGDSSLGWRIDDYNPLVTDLIEGSTIDFPTAAELGPPWIEVAPVPIGMTSYTLWVTPDSNDIPVMWAGSPDQKVMDIAAQASQIEGGEDAGAQLVIAASLDENTTQFDADTGVAKAAGLIDFLLTSEIFAFEPTDGSGEQGGSSLEEAQPGDIIAIGNHEMTEVGEVVYGHEERAAWIEERQPDAPPQTPEVAMEAAAPLGLAADSGASGIDPTKTVGQNMATKSAATQSAKTAQTSKLGDSSPANGGNTEGPLPPGMIILPTWPEMNEMDALPAEKRGIAPKSRITAKSSDTWSSLALKAYDNWEKALALSDHSSNSGVYLEAGAEITLPSSGDLTATTISVNQVEVAKENAGTGIGKETSSGGKGKGAGAGGEETSSTSTGKETTDGGGPDSGNENTRVIVPGSVIKSIAGDTWSGLAIAAYDDFSLFPRLVNYPANAEVKTLPIGEWITIPTLDELMNTEEFGLGLSPNGFPLLTEMVRVPSADELHHVWAEDRSGASSPLPGQQQAKDGETSPINGPGTWVMASDPFDLAPVADDLVEETQEDPVMNPHAIAVQDMTRGDQTTAAIDETKANIRALTDAKLLAEKAEPESTELVIDGVPQAFVDHLKLREGFETEVYKDSLGKLTVGLGHLLVGEELVTYKEGDTVPMSKLTEWANANVKLAYSGAQAQASTLGITDADFIIALASVCFQLGNAWNDIHTKTWGYMILKQYENAATEAQNSQWHSQTPTRVEDFQAALRALPGGVAGTGGSGIPKADLTRNEHSLADNRWIDDGMLSEYGEAFLLIIDKHIKAIFGASETRDSIVDQICELEADECTEEAHEMRAKLFRANQYAVIEVLDVENNDKYKPGKGKTFCNVYAYDVVTALGGYLPRVWWNAAALAKIQNGEPVTAVYGDTVHEMTANMINDWIREYGDDFGWRAESNMETAQSEANSGKIAIILASNVVATKSGHVAVILAETDQLSANGDKPLISQAGATNVEAGAASSKWWENSNHKDGSAWIFEGPLDSPIMTPEQVGGNMENSGGSHTNTNTNTNTGNGGNTSTGPSINGSVGNGGVNNAADVKVVQGLLAEAGFDPGPIDGIAGKGTVNAIKDFQAANFSWKPDGLVAVNGQTWQKLIAGSTSTNTGGSTGTPAGNTITGSVGQGGVNNEADVKVVQGLLAQAGHSPGSLDGVIGTNTIQAIKDFQGANFDFTPDGLVSVNGQTWLKLVSGESADTTGVPEGKTINQRAIVAFDNPSIKLKVRSAPDTNDSSNIVEELEFGAIVQVLSEPNAPAGWYYVLTECGEVGYSAKDYYWMNLPEENPTLYRVKSGETLLGIIDREIPNYGIDRRTLVNVIAYMNSSISVPDTVNGWKNAQINANDIIFLPSQSYANATKDLVNSGSITQEALGQLAAFTDLGHLLSIGALPTDPGDILQFFLDNLGSLLQYVPGIGHIIDVLDKIKKIWAFFDTVIAAIDEITNQIKQKIQEEIEKVQSKAEQALIDHGVPPSHVAGVMAHLNPMLDELSENWWKMVKDGLWDLVWPLPGVWTDVQALFSNLLVAGSHLWDLEISKFVDSVLDIWGNINSALGRLEGWISIGLIAGPTVLGAMAGGVGAIPGFMAGVAAAESFGMALLASTGLEHAAKIVKGRASLYSVDEAGADPDKAINNHIYYGEIAASSLALGVLGGMVVVAAIGAQVGKAIYRGVKARYKKPTPEESGSNNNGGSGDLTGSQIAANNGWPEAPTGYKWEKQGDTAVITKNTGSTDANLLFDEVQGKFVAADQPNLVYDTNTKLFEDADGNKFKYEDGEFKSVEGLAASSMAGKVVRGVSFEDFVSGAKGQTNDIATNVKHAEDAFTHFENENWGALEDLFTTNDYNNWNGTNYPPNNGAISAPEVIPLPEGTGIDRFGAPSGSFVSPQGVPLPHRALPASTSGSPKYYTLLEDIPGVQQGTIMPWFGQPGMGKQYKLPESLQYYLDNDIIALDNSTGKKFASNSGWAEPPTGYRWKKHGDSAIIVNKAGNNGAKLTYVESTGKFIATDRPDLTLDPTTGLFTDSYGLEFSFANGKFIVHAVGQAPGWVEVLNITTIVEAKTPHVLRLDVNGAGTGFGGCHSKVALDDYVSNNPGSSYAFNNKSTADSGGIYTANPVVTKADGAQMVKYNNGGQSSFFPDSWTEAKIKAETEHAIANNHGKIPQNPTGNEYFGFSSDGSVRIHFYLKNNGTLGSYFPKKQ